MVEMYHTIRAFHVQVYVVAALHTSAVKYLGFESREVLRKVFDNVVTVLHLLFMGELIILDERGM